MSLQAEESEVPPEEDLMADDLFRKYAMPYEQLCANSY